MAWSFQGLRSRSIALALAAVIPVLAAPPASRAEPAEPWPARVRAAYKIEFNGFEVGAFEFGSSISGTAYVLTGDARISALLGVISWTGATRSSGIVNSNDPKPAGYTFDFSGAGKSGTIRMGFQGDRVASISQVPPVPVAPGTVPVAESHLKSVLDPLSAVMAMSRAQGANPCQRRVAVFDGRQRFDLVLSYNRQERVAEVEPSGQPGIAYVCRVRYLPIAGHKPDEETRGLAASNGIEIALRPIPSANLFVPTQITIPTVAGSVVLTAQRVEIVTPRNEQIAMVH